MQTLTPTRQSSDEAMAQYLLLRELQLKEQVEALARLPEVATMQSNCQADDMTVNVFDVLEDDFFDEIPLQAPGSPCRSESSMASSTNTACLEGAVPSLPLVVDDAHGAHDSETGVTHWLNAAFTWFAAPEPHVELPPTAGREKHVLLPKCGNKRRRQDGPEEAAAQAAADAWLLKLAKSGYVLQCSPRVEA